MRAVETLDFEGLKKEGISKSKERSREASQDDGSKELTHESPRGGQDKA